MNEKVSQTTHEDALMYPDIALRFRKNIRTIKNWVAQRGMPHYKIGRDVYFKWSSVQSWVDAGCPRPTTRRAA